METIAKISEEDTSPEFNQLSNAKARIDAHNTTVDNIVNVQKASPIEGRMPKLDWLFRHDIIPSPYSFIISPLARRVFLQVKEPEYNVIDQTTYEVNLLKQAFRMAVERYKIYSDLPVKKVQRFGREFDTVDEPQVFPDNFNDLMQQNPEWAEAWIRAFIDPIRTYTPQTLEIFGSFKFKRHSFNTITKLHFSQELIEPDLTQYIVSPAGLVADLRRFDTQYFKVKLPALTLTNKEYYLIPPQAPNDILVEMCRQSLEFTAWWFNIVLRFAKGLVKVETKNAYQSFKAVIDRLQPRVNIISPINSMAGNLVSANAQTIYYNLLACTVMANGVRVMFKPFISQQIDSYTLFGCYQYLLLAPAKDDESVRQTLNYIFVNVVKHKRSGLNRPIGYGNNVRPGVVIDPMEGMPPDFHGNDSRYMDFIARIGDGPIRRFFNYDWLRQNWLAPPTWRALPGVDSVYPFEADPDLLNKFIGPMEVIYNFIKCMNALPDDFVDTTDRRNLQKLQEFVVSKYNVVEQYYTAITEHTNYLRAMGLHLLLPIESRHIIELTNIELASIVVNLDFIGIIVQPVVYKQYLEARVIIRDLNLYAMTSSYVYNKGYTNSITLKSSQVKLLNELLKIINPWFGEWDEVGNIIETLNNNYKPFIGTHDNEFSEVIDACIGMYVAWLDEAGYGTRLSFMFNPIMPQPGFIYNMVASDTTFAALPPVDIDRLDVSIRGNFATPCRIVNFVGSQMLWVRNELKVDVVNKDEYKIDDNAEELLKQLVEMKAPITVPVRVMFNDYEPMIVPFITRPGMQRFLGDKLPLIAIDTNFLNEHSTINFYKIEDKALNDIPISKIDSPFV